MNLKNPYTISHGHFGFVGCIIINQRYKKLDYNKIFNRLTTYTRNYTPPPMICDMEKFKPVAFQERLIVCFEEKTYKYFSFGYENINVTPSKIINDIKPHELKDAINIIHSHPNLKTFSFDDLHFWEDLKRQGYIGKFQIYHHPEKRILEEVIPK